MSDEKIIIAIDGHSSCGKSTMAKSLARKLGYIYIDTGAMYRAVTLYALRKGWISGNGVDEKKIIEGVDSINISFKWDETSEKNTTFMNGENVEDEIRELEVSQYVSLVSAIAEVREEMVKQQRENGKNKGVVMDGRDIGTVVFPEAELKIFMTASPGIRAQRRYLELKEKGVDVNFEEILKNVLERDKIDSGRKVSPLKKAEDAILLDNSDLTREEQLQRVLELVNKIIGKQKNES